MHKERSRVVWVWCAALLVSCGQGQLYRGDAGADSAGRDIPGGDGTDPPLVECNVGFRACPRTSVCVGGLPQCCADSECASGARGTVGACEANLCRYVCAQPAYRACGGDCIPAAAPNCCVSADCSGDRPVCGAAHTCVARPYGQRCATSAECASGACADGVCCDGPCTDKCRSCLAVNTDEGDGTCALVKAGKPHGLDCPALAASTCGSTGKCDGAGGCLDWPATTACAAPSCPADGTAQVGTATCDGRGTCRPGPEASCGTYACDAVAAACRTSCTIQRDCASGYFCGAKGCAKKAIGAACLANEECESLSCGGKCCPIGTPCTCPSPSPRNLLANAGFDMFLQSWSTDFADPAWAGWVQRDDADSCPYSGSYGAGWMTDGTEQPPVLSQCVALSHATTYDLGGKLASNCASAVCLMRFFDGDGCKGSELFMPGGAPTPRFGLSEVSPSPEGFITNWLVQGPWYAGTHSGDWVPPAGTRSGKVVCTLAPSCGAGTYSVKLDDVFVSPSGSRF